MHLEQIQKALAQLSAKGIANLVSWPEDYHAQVWDQRIDEGLEDGRLDAQLAEVDEEYEAGVAEPL